MQRTAINYILCLTLGISALIWGCSPPQTLDSVEGKFTIVFPAGYPAPTKTNQVASTDIGDINVTLYISEKSNGVCMAVFNDYPEGFTEGSDSETILNGCRDGAIQQVGGVLERDEPYSAQNHPGRKFYYAAYYMGQKMYGVQIILLAGNRLYQIGYLGANKDELRSPEIQNYLSSFKIAEGPQ